MKNKKDSISFPVISLEKVRGVLIDLDDTLYFYRPAHMKAMHAIYDMFKKVCDMSFDEFNSQLQIVWDSIYEEKGHTPMAHHRQIVFQKFAEKFKIKRPYSIATRAYYVYFNTVFKCLKEQGPFPEAVNFLKECKKRKIPVCLVTDLFASTQTQKLKALGLTRYIDFIVANDEVGFDKPHPKMFLTALQKLNMKPQDVIMIGNDLEKDIKGAKNLKIRAYHVALPK